MIFKNKTYNYKFAKKIRDVIPDEFVESLGIDTSTLNRKYCRRRSKRNAYVRNVFFDFLRLMIDDCIENNHKFISPNKEYFSVYIRLKKEGERKRILSRIDKVYVDMDILASDGKIYEFILYSKSLHPQWFRNIRIGHHKYKELMQQVNKGRRYFVK